MQGKFYKSIREYLEDPVFTQFVPKAHLRLGG